MIELMTSYLGLVCFEGRFGAFLELNAMKYEKNAQVIGEDRDTLY